ncbi:hypothetical protein SEMRO_3430_G347950.1 [Seminavis robusta]|uniref:Uncharacterized protein n=1 Tax=Seminavis robusta TaxID=568900 RepID=A0A9N8I1D6_9STRA|nr:hypothetical protein SEMRO_3430_G347950.1 [Seminavis robusta]|eukprot:Sro3430_g347950.1 n/a (153) ;mRNA; r:3797-4255
MASTTDKVATDKVATEEIVDFISGDILSEDGREDFVQLEAQMRKGMEHGNGVTDNDVADSGVDEEQEQEQEQAVAVARGNDDMQADDLDDESDGQEGDLRIEYAKAKGLFKLTKKTNSRRINVKNPAAVWEVMYLIVREFSRIIPIVPNGCS